MKRSPESLLEEALTHALKAQNYANKQLDEEIIQDAVSLRLAAMIDVLSRLSTELLNDYFGDAWPLMRGMRNRIVHGYLTVSSEIIEVTVSDELPGVIENISSALKRIKD